MWPWEHFAVAYVSFSLYGRLSGRWQVDDTSVLVLGLATLLPDVIDKPLAWVLTVMPDGTTVAHSVFVAVPLAVTVYWRSVLRDRPDVGVAFAIGYLGHLVGDILYPALRGGTPAYTKVLWPVFTKRGSSGPVLERVGGYSREYLSYLLGPEGRWYLAMELLLVAGTVALWFADGRPGTRWVTRLFDPRS